MEATSVGSFGECEGDRGSRRVARAVEHDRRLFHLESNSLVDRFNDSQVGLMGDEERQLLGLDPGEVEHLSDRGDLDADGPPEDLAAFHVDEAAVRGDDELECRAVDAEVMGEDQLVGGSPALEHAPPPAPSPKRIAVERSSMSV